MKKCSPSCPFYIRKEKGTAGTTKQNKLPCAQWRNKQSNSSMGYSSVFQPFCCSETFRKCLRCSWNPMQWSKCLYCYNRIELWSQISSQAISVCFGGTPGNHSHKPMGFRGTQVETHWIAGCVSGITCLQDYTDTATRWVYRWPRLVTGYIQAEVTLFKSNFIRNL